MSKKTDEKKRVLELQSYNVNGSPSKAEFQEITKLASQICNTPVSLIDIIDEHNQNTIATYGDWDNSSIPRENSICDLIVANGDLLEIKDVKKNEEIRGRLSDKDISKIGFYAGAPIRTPNGYALGALCVIDSLPRELDESQKEGLQTLANEVMARLQLHKKNNLLKLKNKKLEKYSIFLENSADLLCIIDPDSKKIIEINERCRDALGFEVEELIGRKFLSLVETNTLDSAEDLSIEKVKKWFEDLGQTKRIFLPLRLKHKDRSTKWFSCTISVENQHIYLTAKDVHEQKLAEEKIKALQKKFEKITNATSDLLWEYDFKSGELIFDEDLCELFGYSKKDLLVDIEWWVEKIHQEDREDVLKKFESFTDSENKYWHDAYRFRNNSGSYHFIFDNAYIERDKNGRPLHIVGAMTDLTDLKKAELEQKRLLSRLNHANHIAELGYWELHLNDDRVFWSDEMYHILNTDKESTKLSLDYVFNSMTEEDEEQLLDFIHSIREDEKVAQFEHEVTLPDLSVKYLFHRGELQYDNAGKPDFILIITQDITRRKNIELNLSKSLEEKATLLAEVHHRVKNNLAIISGLLELELYGTEDNDPVVSDFIRKSHLRILSMAKIHEILYKSETFTHVSFKEYIEDLLRRVDNTLNKEGDDITFVTHIDDVELNINQAIPCGLILNELISNSMKHAFPNKEEGIIEVTFRAQDDKINIRVADNGVGLSGDFDVKKTSKMGLMLVKTLCSQLNAVLNISHENEFVCEITFIRKDGKGSSSGIV